MAKIKNITMRTIKELLELMRDNDQFFVTGLCGWAANLWMDDFITSKEHTLINCYLENNLPPKKPNKFCWRIAGIKPRLKWINKHIKLNS